MSYVIVTGQKKTNRECFVSICTRKVPDHCIVCLYHWSILPKSIKNRITIHRQLYFRSNKKFNYSYVLAWSDAIDYLSDYLDVQLDNKYRRLLDVYNQKRKQTTKDL